MNDGAWLYILLCADGSYYCGTARRGLELRVVYSQRFERITDAIAAERQVKGWSRAKKDALIRGDFDEVRALSKRAPKAKLEYLFGLVAMLRDSRCARSSA